MIHCNECGAYNHGNLTCRRCRRIMRAKGIESIILDRLDAENVPTIPPVDLDSVRAFLNRIRRPE